jgi:hypothetical protein
MRQIHKTWILIAALAFIACPASGYAQDASAPAATGNAQAKNIQMVGARALLNKGIDAKKAKQGDPVTAKLQDDVKIPDAAELPKNTVLLGHVDQVQPSEKKSDSSVQVTFDKAQLKNGQQLPIKATIVQIAPPPNAMALSQSGASGGSGASAMPSSSPAPAASGGGGGTSGGGSSQASSSTPSMAPSTASSMPDPSQQQPSQQGGMPDVSLQSDIHQQNSGTFTSKGKNVHLTDGTQMQIAVAVIPANTQIK